MLGNRFEIIISGKYQISGLKPIIDNGFINHAFKGVVNAEP
jgi:hypothetical protein